MKKKILWIAILVCALACMISLASCKKESDIEDSEPPSVIIDPDNQGDGQGGEEEHVHSYIYVVVTEPTCTEEGERLVLCRECGYSFTEVIPANGHEFVSVRTEPTCTEEGRITYSCTVCGYSYTETIAAVGHQYDAEVVSATCTEDGYIRYVCSVCGDSYTESIAALGHDYKVTGVTASTCTEKGGTVYACSRCGDRFIESTPALGHDYKVTSVVEPTCTEKGKIVYTCSRCGDRFAESTPALGHDYVATSSIEPTCTEAGRIVYTCSRNDGSYSEVIPALGHAFGEWIVTTEPTYHSSGSLERVCERDASHTETVVLPPLGDSAYSYETIEAATSTANGSCSYTISYGGSTFTFYGVIEKTDLSSNGLVFFLENDNTYTVIGYNGEGGSVYIGGTYNGLPIGKIDEYAFRNNSSITQIVIEEVKTIGDYAFMNCSALESVVIGKSVACIGYSAFYRCNSLASVVFADAESWNYYIDDEEEGTLPLASPQANAAYITFAYHDYIWKKG